MAGYYPNSILLRQHDERTNAVNNALRSRRRRCRRRMGAIDPQTLSAVCRESDAFCITVRLESTL